MRINLRMKLQHLDPPIFQEGGRRRQDKLLLLLQWFFCVFFFYHSDFLFNIQLKLS